MLSANDDALGVMRNMGVSLERRQQFFTTGSMIAVINSVVGEKAEVLIPSPPAEASRETGGE